MKHVKNGEQQKRSSLKG